MMTTGLVIGILFTLSIVAGGWLVYKSKRNWVKIGYLGLNLLFLVGVFFWGASLIFPNLALAADGVTAQGNSTGLGYLAAGLAVGLASVGAGIGVGIAGSAAIGAISEKPDILGRALIFIGLAEGLAIYGLIISIMILSRI